MRAIIIALFILGSTSLHAAGDYGIDSGMNTGTTYNSQNNSGTGYNYNAANGVSEGVLNNTMTTDMPQWDSTNDSTGRGYRSDSASSSGMAGGIVATATGGTLLGIGTMMVMSLNPIIVAAGIDLIGKGTQELTQGIVDMASSSDNADQHEMLTKADASLIAVDSSAGLGSRGSAGLSADALNKIRQQVMTPDFQQMLTDRGVNSEYVFEQLTSGQPMEAGDIASLFGDTRQWTADQLSQGQGLANEKLAEVMAEQENLTVDEGAKDEASLLVDKSLVGTESAGSELSSDMADGDLGAADPSLASAEGLKDFVAAQAGKGIDGAAMMKSMMGKLSKNKEKSRVYTVVQLKEMGIVKSKKAESIFTKAAKTYRSFKRWRKGYRVAQR